MSLLTLLRKKGEFNPLSINGYFTGFDASDQDTITETSPGSGIVTAWEDAAGTGYTVSNSSGGQRPETGLETINGLNTITCQGTSWLTGGSNYLFSDTGITAFIVARPKSTNAVSFLFDEGLFFGSGFGLSVSENTLRAYSPVNHGGADTTVVKDYSATARIYTVRIEAGGSHEVWVDGRRDVNADMSSLTGLTTTEISEASTRQTSSGPFTLFHQSKSGLEANRQFIGDVGEMIFYDRPLTDAEIAKIESYLSNKWGTAYSENIALSSGTFSATATAVPVRISKDNYQPDVDWDGVGHFMLSDETIPKQNINVLPVLRNDAMWTWFNRPEAVYKGGYTYVGWTEQATGDWYIGQYNHATGAWAETNLGDDGTPQIDDHNNTTIVVDDDGIIHVFASEHNTSTIRHFISDAAHDISAFSTVNLLTSLTTTATYPQPELINGGTEILLTWRESTTSGQRKFVIYDIAGDSYGSERNFIANGSNTRPYMHTIVDPDNDDKVHVVFTDDHPNEITQGENDIYHAYYLRSTDSFYKSDDTLIGAAGSVALAGSNATMIEDATTRGFNFWNAGIAVCPDGNPAVVYSEHENRENMNYRYAKWDGSAWNALEIVADAGQSLYGAEATLQPSYMPGLHIADHGQTVFYSKDGTYGQHGIYKAITTDYSTFSHNVISAEGGREKFRPVAVRNASPELECVFLAGNYTDYFTIDASLCCYPTTAAQSFHVDGLIEVDTDGGDIDVLLKHKAATTDDSYTDEVLVVPSQSARRKLTGSQGALQGRTAFTVLVAGNASSLSSGTFDDILISDWNPTGARSVLARSNASENPQINIEDTVGTKTLIATDLTISAGADFGLAVRMNTTTLSAALNGSVSGITTATSGTVKASTLNDISMGQSPHDSTETLMWDGDIYFVGIYSTAKTDAWMQMATQGVKGVTF